MNAARPIKAGQRCRRLSAKKRVCPRRGRWLRGGEYTTAATLPTHGGHSRPAATAAAAVRVAAVAGQMGGVAMEAAAVMRWYWHPRVLGIVRAASGRRSFPSFFIGVVGGGSGYLTPMSR